MSVPNQFGPPTQQPGGGGGGIVAVVVLVALLLVLLGCGVLCAGVLFVYRTAETALREAPAVQRARSAVRAASGQPPPRPQWVNDWTINRLLAPVYTTALDAVAADQKVIDRLGDSIEPVQVGDGAELYRRLESGEIDTRPLGIRAEETIQFDVQGSQGTATVSVVATAPEIDTPTGSDALRVTKITVTLRDGATIDLPPPGEQPAFRPIR